MALCINICDPILDLQYEVLETGTYTITIISNLKERYVATIDFTLGDNLELEMPPLNESMGFKVIVEVNGLVETTIYFTTYPYLLELVQPVVIP